MELNNNASLFVNIGLIIMLIFLMYRGYKKGFISQIIGLFSLLLSGLIAWILYVPFGKLFNIAPKALVPFQSTILHDFFYLKINSMLWFIIIFITALLMVKFITKVLDLLSRAPFINLFNRLLGLGFSLINFLVVSWLAIFLLSTPLFVNGEDVIETSLLKHNKVIFKVLDPVLEKPIEELKSTQSIRSQPEQATTEDIENMQEWLVKNKVAIDDVIEFFKEIKDE